MIHQGKLYYTLLLLTATSLGLFAQSSPVPERPTLGVALHTEGLAVESVDKGTLAETAGLHSGDFLTHWNDQPTADIESIIRLRDEAEPGSTISLRVMRTTGDDEVLKLVIPDPIPAEGLLLGINIGPGLWVARVDAGGAAELAGIKPGDVLLMMGNQEIGDVESLKAALGRVTWNTAQTMTVRRGGGIRRVVVPFVKEGNPGPAIGRSVPRPPTSFPHQAPSGIDLPSLSSSLMGLGEIKAEIDSSIADLKAMADPKLSSVIERLEAQSSRLTSLAESVNGLKSWGIGFMRDMGEQIPGVPFVKDLDLRNLHKLMEDLMQRHGDDLDAVRKALSEAYPGLEILIDSVPGHLELMIETEDETQPEGLEENEQDRDHKDHAEGKKLEIIEVVPAPTKSEKK